MKRNPGFFAVALTALALGIGANTAIFSAVEGVLLHPLPYADPSRLVMVWEDASYLGFSRNTPAAANYVDWRAQNQVFRDMAAMRYSNSAFNGDRAPEQALGRRVTPNFFDVLGVQPVVGRPFTAEEDATKQKVVVLSDALWQRRFGGNPAVVGRSILMDGEATTVVGIMPSSFFFPDHQTDYWIPASFTPEDLARRTRHNLEVVARMKQGVTRERAQRDMEVIAKRLELQYPDTNANIGAVVVPIRENFAGDTATGLWVLQIAAVLVLLIACSNLANLLLARAAGRRREIAVRVALGASRGQIAAQLITESLLLSVGGGVAGLVVGRLCWSMFRNLVPSQIAGNGFLLNAPVLMFTAAISILAGVFFGIVPALRATDVSLQASLKEGARAGESRGGMRLRDTLVVAQFAMAFALLVGASLMIETLWNLRRVDLGFRSDHLLTMGVPLPDTKYNSNEKLRAFYQDVLDRTRTLPGVKNVGFGSDVPFTSIGDTEGYAIEGAPPTLPGQDNDALYREVTAGYLETIGGTLESGRLLEDRDIESGQPVVVINEFLAKRHWPGVDPVGKRLKLTGSKEPWRTVVGVVKDIRERGLLLDMKPAVYVPVNQVDRPGADYLVARTSEEPAGMVNALRGAVWAVDADRPVAFIRTMDQLMEENVADRERPMTLLGIFAGLALVLACIGVYGVLAYSVAQRTREIGVRMALGARPLDVTRMILGRGLRLSAIGLIAGAALAGSLGVLLRTLLFGVTPAAPLVYSGTAASLMIVALAACVVPAQRAARVDPMVALRHE
ncbi:MAG TPA: ABC transporter permease [Candidatus Cybelea sp.]|nr:ABC transporter permease [Candidatus Cybelea sp.]